VRDPCPLPFQRSEPTGTHARTRPRSLRRAQRPWQGAGTQRASGHSSRCSSRQGQAPAGWPSLGAPGLGALRFSRWKGSFLVREIGTEAVRDDWWGVAPGPAAWVRTPPLH